MRYSGFEPCMDGNAKILILGSFPSVKSRENAFFYGNPHNRFWKLLAEIYGAATPQSVDEKKSFLLSRNIALWDIVSECEIEGSLDSNIKNYVVADLDKVLKQAKIEKILLNGGTAAKIFFKHYPQLATIAVALPSTSPANARFDKTDWLSALK